MAQSLSKIIVHLVFSTKNRERVLTNSFRPELHDYMGGTLRGLKCPAIEINTEPDHAHVLFLLHRTEALSDVVGQMKTATTDWIQKQIPGLDEFHWQNGFGAFSVSQSNVEEVREYIRNQREHHRHRTFQEEF